MENSKAVLEIQKAEITDIFAIYHGGAYKNRKECFIRIDFGPFFIADIGIYKNEKEELTWSHRFGNSNFSFNYSTFSNPWHTEIAKIGKLISEEIKNRKEEIIYFLKTREGSMAINKIEN